MASGNFSTNVTTRTYTAEPGYTAYLYWNETATGINGTTPYSTVSVTFKMKKIASWANAYNTGTGLSYTFKVDGTSNETGNITYNTQGWTLNTEYTLWTKSINVNHSSDGSKTVALALEITDTVLSDFNLSGNAVLTNIAMASTVALSASSVNLGTSNATITANITRYSTSYYHKLIWKIGSTTVSTVNAGQVASSTYTLTPSAWLTKMTNSPSASCSVVLETYSNSGYTTKIGNSSTATFTLKCTANPSSTISVSPTGTSVTQGVSTTAYFNGKTQAVVAVTGTGVQGSTISSLKIYQDDTLKYTRSSNGSWTSSALMGTGTITFKVVVADSRGKTSTATAQITVSNYSIPSVSATAQRCNSSGTVTSSGTYLKVKATGTATGTGNSITSVKVSTKTASGTAVQSNVSLTNGTAQTIGSGQYLVSTSYVATFTVTDKMGETATVTKSITTSSRVINVKDGGTGVAFGKFAEEAGVLDTPWKIRVVNNAFEIKGDNTTKLSLHDSNDDLLGAFSFTDGRYRFSEYSHDSVSGDLLSRYEMYRLPAVDDDRTSNGIYEILTTKAPVAIEEGGTGATTLAGIRENLQFLRMYTFQLASGTAKNFTVPSNSRHFIVVGGTAAGRSGAFIVAATSTGSMGVLEVAKGASLTYATATNTLTLTASGGAATVMVITMYGSDITG